ncbi:MAG TPA: hypothetical protein VFR97_12855 [Capillimicrobium sp.]|nr:hypothetical protein [Capillimicrobium sp.]
MERHLFDELARGAAAPMPRRRMLRVLGGALVAGVVPAGLWPRRAEAAGCPAGSPVACGDPRFGVCCTTEQLCCPDFPFCCPPASSKTSDGRPVRTTCGPAGPTQSPCASHIGCPPNTTGCGAGSGAYEHAACCQANEECQNGVCVPKCPSGRARCGSTCCAEGEECENGRCVKTCPRGRVRCRDRCCERGERCVEGRCRKCSKGRRGCGDTCCPKGHDCCYDDKRFICCDTKRRSCCHVGPPGKKQVTCCPKGTTCGPMILPGNGGITKDSPTVCCPPDRVVPLGRDICCPPGTVSLGGKLTTVSGLCCPKGQVCGSGDGITCCPTGMVCRDGACVVA